MPYVKSSHAALLFTLEHFPIWSNQVFTLQ